MPKKSRDLSAFKNEFDKKLQIRQRLIAALAALRKQGKEEWRTERELVDTAGVSCKNIGEFRKEFEAHIVTVPSKNRGREKTIWFADPKVAAKVRQ
jgi:hypothetical protein